LNGNSGQLRPPILTLGKTVKLQATRAIFITKTKTKTKMIAIRFIKLKLEVKYS